MLQLILFLLFLKTALDKAAKSFLLSATEISQ